MAVLGSTILTAILAAVAFVAYYINELFAKRRRLKGLPQPPMQNLLLGHLQIADELTRVFPKGIHSHVWQDYIRTKWDLPETFYLDWRPFGPLWLHSADPEFVAEFVMVKQSLPKSSLETGYLNQFLGKNNLVSIEGEHHKKLRSIFNPGFSQAHLMTYADAIVEATERFAEILRHKAASNEHFELEEYATRMTIDIIGLAVFDVDMKAQLALHPIVEHFRDRVMMMPPADAIFPWQAVDLFRPLKLWFNNRKLEAAINVELKNKIDRRRADIDADKQGKTVKQKRKSIIDLALSAYEKETALGKSDGKLTEITDIDSMPPSLRLDLVDSIKTFFFAGHDTTSSTICWFHYLMHRYPEAWAKLEAELNQYFPPGTSAGEKIKQDPYILNKLEYTTACIKETMRIFPPASSFRSHQGSANQARFIDPRSGVEHDLAGVEIWPTAHMIQRNQRFYPKPTQFIPERFIAEQTPFPEAELFTPAGKHAFQPFSVGPRNCIGQELAMIEAKVVVALTAREFDFVLEYPGEEPDPQPPIPESTAAELAEDSEYGKAIRAGAKHTRVEGHRIWQTLKGSAKPVGGAPGRIKLRR